MIIVENIIAFKLNQTYKPTMGKVELYDITRHSWKVGERRNKAKYAFAVFEGVVKEVYTIAAWLPQNSTLSTKTINDIADLNINTERWEFVGNIAPDEIKAKYLGKDMSDYFKSNQNPVAYINC
jgi:hypothetical protein